jgi:hypothetical protein
MGISPSNPYFPMIVANFRIGDNLRRDVIQHCSYDGDLMAAMHAGQSLPHEHKGQMCDNR